MTAIELANIKQDDLRSMQVSELESIKKQAWDAYKTVGDSPRFTKTLHYPFERSFNKLEQTAKLAEMYIDLKQGR